MRRIRQESIYSVHIVFIQSTFFSELLSIKKFTFGLAYSVESIYRLLPFLVFFIRQLVLPSWIQLIFFLLLLRIIWDLQGNIFVCFCHCSLSISVIVNLIGFDTCVRICVCVLPFYVHFSVTYQLSLNSCSLLRCKNHSQHNRFLLRG